MVVKSVSRLVMTGAVQRLSPCSSAAVEMPNCTEAMPKVRTNTVALLAVTAPTTGPWVAGVNALLM